LLNPSVRPKHVLVLLNEEIYFELNIKVEECWKYEIYHSTHFMFLSEVQHISTCSNNVCPYVKDKKPFKPLIILSFFHPS